MNTALFSKKQIIRLLLPLIVEQFLAVMVGMADTIMIASVGETAVSGISVVDNLNTLLIQVFAALATGGAVVAAHYLGAKDENNACQAANQLLLVMLVFSSAISVVALVFNGQLLYGIFGHLEDQVMSYARIYFYITALSFPFLAVYNGSAAICRSMGNSGLSMKVSLLMNGMNVAGNAVLIYGLKLDVAGAAVSTLISRITAAVIMVIIIRNPSLPLHISNSLHLGFRPWMIRKILNIGIPIAVENSMFQGGKLIVAGLISSFGTASIAANAVGGNVASFEGLAGQAIGLGIVTVVGQAVGAKRYDEAKGYAVKMCLIVMVANTLISVPIMAALPLIVNIYHLSAQTAQMAEQVSMLHGICCILIWAPAFALPNAFRAADDVKYTMVISVASMIFCRVIMSYVLGRNFGMGLYGVWVAMMLDWVVRDVFFLQHFISGKWLLKHKNVHDIKKLQTGGMV